MKTLLAVHHRLALTWLRRLRPASSLLFSCTLLLASGAARGQLTNVGDTTATPIPGAGHDYIHLLSETVNPANGSVSLRIQLPVPKARGITIPFSINYDSNAVHHLEPNPDLPGVALWGTTIPRGVQGTGGWTYGIPSISYSYFNSVTGPQGAFRTGYGTPPPSSSYIPCSNYTNYMFTDLNGGQHPLYLGTYYSSNYNGACQSSGGAGRANGAGDTQVLGQLPDSANDPNNPSAAAPFPVNVYTPDGTVYTFNGAGATATIEDRNGNMASVTDTSNNAANTDTISVQDTAGRPVISYIWPLNTALSQQSLAIGGLTYGVSWTTTTANASVPNNWIAGFEDPNNVYGCGAFPTMNDTQSAISQISLPDGQSYKLYYGTNVNPLQTQSFPNSYGLLNEVDYPTGAWVQYQWSTATNSTNYNELANYPGVINTPSGCSSGDAYQPCLAPVPDGCLYQYATPVVATRQVGLAQGSTPAQTQTFTYATTWGAQGTSAAAAWTQKTTTVVTTDDLRGVSATTNYTYSPYSIPNNDPIDATGSFPQQVPSEKQIVYNDYTGAPLETVTKTWLNQYQLQSVQTLPASGSASQTAYSYAGSFPFSLLQETDEYDYGASSPTRMTHTQYQQFSGAPGHLANGACSVVVCSGGSSCSASSSNRVAETDYYYDGGAALCTAGPASTSAVAGPALPQKTHDETLFSSAATTPRGNVTQVNRQCWPNCSNSVTTYAYDETGQVSSMIDPCGTSTCSDMTGTSHTTTYAFGDNPAGGNQPGNSNAYLTQITAPNTGVAHVQSYQYDYRSGELIQTLDQNNVITAYSYNDPLNRLKLVDNAVGKLNWYENESAESKTSYNYPSATELDVFQDQFTTGDAVLKSSTFYDGLGRTARAVGRDGSVVETAYDGLGRVCAVSNPTFNDPGQLSCIVGQNKATSGTDGYTYFIYDSLGRKTLQTQPDLNTLQWAYNGNVVDYYDEDHSHWQRTNDALGRLTKALENDPAGSGVLTLETDYTYDPLNNLTSVNQKGASGDAARYRTFAYDSLSRLTYACNPEAIATGSSCTPNSGPWSETYSYDGNSNVKTRTDARGVITTYNYDALNRMLTKTYTNDPANTPALSYTYDQEYAWQVSNNENNPIGNLQQITATLGTTTLVTWTSDDYDQRDNLLGYVEWLGAGTDGCSGAGTDGCPGDGTAYAYNLDGTPIGLGEDAGATGFNPGQSVWYGYDTAGRLNSITSYVYPDASPSLTSTVFSGITYYPGGAVKTANLAVDPTTQIPGITLSRTYDNRGRITGETDLTSQQQSAYNYSVNYDGNGNVTGYDDSATGVSTVTNDALHRLFSMSGTLAGAAYTVQETYDHFGNRNVETVTAGSNEIQPSPYLHFAAGSNRADGGNYDNAGNLFSDGTNNYLYDAENRICAVQQIASGGGGSAIGYLYAPDGTRLGKNGNLTSFSCDMTKNGMLTSNGIVLTNIYTVGPRGEQLEETDGNYNLIHLNVFWEGKVLGSYSGAPFAQTNWRFALNDWVGTKRVTTKSDGSYSNSFLSGPFGDFQTPGGAGSDPSEHHFTGKERDTESGLDNFGARYYGSSMGRFMSPDWEPFPVPVPNAILDNPQSLNLYAYGLNNPLTNVDEEGHDVNVCTTDSSGNQNCTLLTNEQYQAAQSANNGGLNVPSLNTVGTNGSANITDTGGNTVGTATYVSNGGFDYYGNQSFYNQLGTTGATVGSAKFVAGFYGASLLGGAAGSLAIGEGGLATLGDLSLIPQIGSKLNYLLGQATGSAYNIQRSLSMAAALSKIGLTDSPETRDYIAEKLAETLNSPASIAEGSFGSSVRDTLIMGPGGAVKLQSIWQGTQLITLKVFGGR